MIVGSSFLMTGVGGAAGSCLTTATLVSDFFVAAGEAFFVLDDPDPMMSVASLVVLKVFLKMQDMYLSALSMIRHSLRSDVPFS